MESWLTVGPRRCTAIGVVAELMHVHAMFSVGVITMDFVDDGGVGGLVGLFERDGSADFGVTAKDCNCRDKEKLVMKFSLATVYSSGPEWQRATTCDGISLPMR